VVPPLTDFRDVRRPSDINPGSDLGGTGHTAMNFTGAAAGSDTWITVYDTTPDDDTVKNIFGNVALTADVLIHSYNPARRAWAPAARSSTARTRRVWRSSSMTAVTRTPWRWAR
jgi:hypothetical protein